MFALSPQKYSRAKRMLWLTMTGLCGVILFAVPTNSLAQQDGASVRKHRQAVEPFLDQEIVAFAYLDLENIDLEAPLDKLVTLGIIDPSEVTLFRGIQTAAQAQIKELARAGAESVYFYFRASDFNLGGPSIRIQLKSDADLERLKPLIEECLESVNLPFEEMEPSGDSILIANSEAQIESMKQVLAGTSKPVRRDEAFWAGLQPGSAGMMIFTDGYTKRVIRELMPKLPDPFGEIDGKLVADRIHWISASVDIREKRQGVKLLVQATNVATAQKIESAFNNLLPMIRELPMFQDRAGGAESQPLSREETEQLAALLGPTRNESRVELSTDRLMNNPEEFSRIMRAGLTQLREASVAEMRQNRLRELALAALNYESAYRRFPPRYSINEDGKPLLSWRVHVLPFAGDLELYQQFHLDEPWDSEHNLKLVKQMPKFLYDSDPASLENNGQGKTIYQAPAGEAFVLRVNQEMTFKNLTDGSSNTLLFAAVAPSEAAIWTKPDDWEVDLADPTAKLKHPDRKGVEIARCDGSVDVAPLSKSVAWWRTFLLPDDGNILVW